MKFKHPSTSRLIILAHDTTMTGIAWLAAFWLRFNLYKIPHDTWKLALHTLPIVILIQMTVALWAGIYRGMWRFASIPDLMRILKSIVVGSAIILGTMYTMNHLINLPRAVFPLYAILLTACWSGPRILYRIIRDYVFHQAQQQRVLVVGAGQAGEGLVRDLLRSSNREYLPVAILDDDFQRQGKDIHGVRVVGKTEQLDKYIQKYQAELVMLAIPSANSKQMQALVKICDAANIPYRTLPSIADITENRVTINALRKVEIEDLLGRDPVKLDWSHIGNAIKHQTILVTGGGGSIGGELCRQIAKQQPKQLIIVEHSEFNLYLISQELNKQYPSLDLKALLVDTSNHKFINATLNRFRPDVIFHAAAYKHVPLLENQLSAAVKNNIFATRTLADLAVQYRVKKFVLVSSDKAVNPTNIMGLSKRVAEIYTQNLNEQSDTNFITVRFGNVLGSTGSVVPLFRQQLEQGGPITVTHPDMTRYFMTIPEATSLILQAYTMGQGGEIFVLDMGEPIKIQYLAEQMIRLAGKTPNKDIDITYTGVRPGEKLFEELFHGSETLKATTHQKISLANARQVAWVDLLKSFDEINIAFRHENETDILNILKSLVPEYKVNEEMDPRLNLG